MITYTNQSSNEQRIKLIQKKKHTEIKKASATVVNSPSSLQYIAVKIS